MRSILLLVILSSSTSSCNVSALKSNFNEIRESRRPFPNQLSSSSNSSVAARVRGGFLEKKRKNPFGVASAASSNTSDTDNEERAVDTSHKKTALHTQSSIIQESNEVDAQYRHALIKTALTVLAAGKT